MLSRKREFQRILMLCSLLYIHYGVICSIQSVTNSIRIVLRNDHKIRGHGEIPVEQNIKNLPAYRVFSKGDQPVIGQSLMPMWLK